MNPPRAHLPPSGCRILGGLWLATAFVAETQAQNSADAYPNSSSRSSFPSGDMPMRLDPVLIFFPPNPPPLGRAIARGAATPVRLAAPPELAAYVNEPFYPALSTRLVTRTLSEKQRAQLERYREAKLALQRELQTELDRLHDAEPGARIAELATFARRQAPRLAELEKTAEDLRRDLITSDYNWSALRQWRLGDNDRRGFSPLEIGQVMRGYAFYQNGLLPAQRRLLREISLELSMAADSTANATAAQPYLFFPPEPARVLLPDDLPADVAAQIAAYQTKKSTLKKELYDAVFRYDGQKFGFLRGNSLKALAEKQAGPLAELETLAEDIRRRLVQVAEPTAIAERSPLPPVLQARVAALLTRFASLQKESTAQVEAILAEARGMPMQATYRFEGDGLKFTVIPSRGGRGGFGSSAEVLERVTAVRNKLGAIADDYGRQVAELINEKDAIRTEISQTLGKAKGTAIDNAMFAAMRVATAKETESSYREYRVAVFQPGLSPEQRRLLFAGVMERLDLPLPRGEFQPIFRANSW